MEKKLLNLKGMRVLAVLALLMLLSFTVHAQTVTGIVTGMDDGQPIPGVNIKLKGTERGTITDLDGKYSIDATGVDAVLIFSYVGYAAQEITVGTQTTIDVSLAPGEDLEEVVVVGYGVKKKSLVTGSISSVKGDDIAGAKANVASAMQGKTAGVTILPSSGAPGAAIKVRIRGTSSNGKSDPLYIVDGVKMTDISFLDPNDVESIEVLKDGASSAIYGAEGGNGVLMITTKKGKSGAAEINYGFQYGMQSAPELPELLNASDYTTYIDEVRPGTSSGTGYKADTDWLDEIFENAPIQKHYLSISAGNDKSSVMGSISYLNQDGIVGGSKANYERITGRINAEYNARKWLKMGVNMGYTFSERKNLPEDSRLDGLMARALLMDPFTPVVHQSNDLDHIQEGIDGGNPYVTDADGNYYGISRYTSGETVNPALTLALANGSTKTNQLTGSGFLNITPIKGLVITSRLGFNYSHANNHFFNKPYYYSGERNVSNANATVEDQMLTRAGWQWENFASFNKSFNDHDLGAVLGVSIEKNSQRHLRAVAGAMVVPNTIFSEMDYTMKTVESVYGGNMERRVASFFGRLSYSYASKYLLELSLRRDGTGTATLPDGSNWGTFSSVSAGWVLSNEDFWSIDAISYAKIRGSFGQNGSLSNLVNYTYSDDMTAQGTKYPLPVAGQYVPVWEADTQGNSDLTWETSEQLDLGLDLRFFNDKLTFGFDYFKKTTKDLLTLGSPVMSSGQSSPYINAGDVENSGLEFEVGYQNREGELKYSVNFNVTTLKNEVTNVNNNITLIEGTQLQPSWFSATAFKEGEPIWYFRGYKTDGFDSNGHVIIHDENGDGEITTADRTNIGDPHPDLLYGFNINLEYKGFDFNIAASGSRGNDVLIGWLKTDRANINIPKFMFDGRGSSYPIWDRDDEGNTLDPHFAQAMQSDLLVEDGSYLRIRQIGFGYTLPGALTKTIGLNRVRLGVSLENYFTFTKYQGIDPEAGSVEDNVFNAATSNKGTNASQGIDRGSMPIPRTVLFNLNIGF